MTPDLLPLLVAVLFPGIIALVSPWLRLLPAPYLMAVEVALACVPAAAWLWFYRRQDKTEKEPLVFVLTSSGAGALVTAAVGSPLTRALFTGEDWPYRSTLILIAGSVLLPGILMELLKYLSVRYTVYLNPEFSEPLDGIVYTTAAGLGAALALNILYVISYGGVDPTVGAIHFSIQTMGQAAFAGITGYALGAMKFGSPRNDWRAASALMLAAVSNGLFFWALEAVAANGLDYSPWRSLLLAAAVAAAVSWGVYRLMGRARSAGGAGQELAGIQGDSLPAVDRRVILAAVLMLGMGLGLRYAVSGGVESVKLQDGTAIAYPSGWRTQAISGREWAAVNPRSGSAFTTTLSVLRGKEITVAAAPGSKVAPAPLADQASQHLIETAGKLPFFREVSFEEREVAGRPTAIIGYMYVADPLKNQLTGGATPVVVRGVRAYSVNDGKLTAVEFETADANWVKDARVWDSVLSRLSW